MGLEILDPPLDDFVVRIPRLDGALVDLALKVLLRLFMRERTARDGPERALGWEVDDARDGDREGGCGVRGEVQEEVEEPRVV